VSSAKELIAAGAVVLDVRKPDEFAAGHLPTATNIPVQDFESRIAEVEALVGGDKAAPIVVHCMLGKRAAAAKELLEKAGYTNVTNGISYNDLK
jgi:rhodanese-related sulfurtransferase